MNNDHYFDVMDNNDGMPNYYVGVMPRDFINDETINLYGPQNLKQ